MKKIITLLAACSLTLLVQAGGDKDKSCCAGKEKGKTESCSGQTVSATRTETPKSCGSEKKPGCCADKKEAGSQKEKVTAPKEDVKVKKS